MPVLALKLSGAEDPALAKELVKTISELTKQHLNKKPEVTVVTVSFIPDYLWFINSQSLKEMETRSFHLNIQISDSTNLKDHKAVYISAIHSALVSHLGNVHPVSYTSIQELKADAYGYEGLTIEYKIISNKINAAK